MKMDEAKFGTNKQNTIPLSRVRTIMKSSPDVANIKEDTLYTVCRATELFIQTLTKESYKNSNNSNTLEYENLAKLIAKDDRFKFLAEIIPFKMKAKEALRQIELAEKR